MNSHEIDAALSRIESIAGGVDIMLRAFPAHEVVLVLAIIYGRMVARHSSCDIENAFPAFQSTARDEMITEAERCRKVFVQ